MVRAALWPLFGLSTLPEISQWQQSVATLLFGRGHAKRLGDDFTYIIPGVVSSVPEVAIIGRSNAGKSTLVNTLLRAKGLAATSKTPGRTRRIQFYGVSSSPTAAPLLAVADMPGYGFASASRAEREKWDSATAAYISTRESAVLRRVLVLMDSRRGMTPLDSDFLDFLDLNGVGYVSVLTKCDLLSDAEYDRTCAAVVAALARRVACYPVLCAISAQRGHGLKELAQVVVAAALLTHY